MPGLTGARALATAHNDNPPKASRPFDAARDGFVMGEGAGIVVLESAAHEKARGATILARLLGYGTTADAHHITAPREDGEGPRRAMQIALKATDLRPTESGNIHAHATTTPDANSPELTDAKGVYDRRKMEWGKRESVRGTLGVR